MEESPVSQETNPTVVGTAPPRSRMYLVYIALGILVALALAFFVMRAYTYKATAPVALPERSMPEKTTYENPFNSSETGTTNTETATPATNPFDDEETYTNPFDTKQ